MCRILLTIIVAALMLSISVAQSPEFTVTLHDNLALQPADSDSWEATYTYAPSVVFHEDVFHMFYSGISRDGSAVGYARSEDGLTFERSTQNPILPSGVYHSPAVAVMEDGMWLMILSEQAGTVFHSPRLWRATAEAPEGPWLVDEEPIYDASEFENRWDEEVNPRSLIVTADGIYLFIDGRPAARATVSIGVLFSEDGRTFAPLSPDDDDLAQISLGAAESADQWDNWGVGAPIAFLTDDGFEMFYLGFASRFRSASGSSLWIGYATSPDAVNWTRSSVESPAFIIEPENQFAYLAGTRVDDTYYFYYAVNQGADGIAVATVDSAN